MNTRNGALSFDAYIGDTDFNRTIQSMNRKIEGLTKTTQTESQKMESIFSNLGRLAAGGIAAAGLAELPQQILKVRGEFQQLEISFTTMLRSKARADKMIGDIARFAADTPYGLAETAQATKLLIAYGHSAETTLETLRRLGDVASGVSQPLGEIAYLYGTTMVQGRLYTQDLNQFLGRGIPILHELANILGVADSEVKGLVEAGKVGFPEVQKAFENMTAAGSMFGGLMEAQSKSLVGLQSTLGDAVDAMFNDFGKSQEGFLTAVFQGTIGLVENYEKVLDVLKVLVVTYGTYRAALLLTAALQGNLALVETARMWLSLASSVKTAKDAQILFNLAVSANPYVLVATAIAALVAGYYVFGDSASEAAKAQEKLNEATKKSDQEMNKEIANIEVLKKQLQDETKTRAEKEIILNRLISLNPQLLNGITLENIGTARSTELIGQYIRAKKEQIRVSNIQAQIDENLNRVDDIQSGRADGDFGMSFIARAGLGMAASAAGMSGGYLNQGDLAAKNLKENKDKAVQGLKDLNKGLLDQVNNGIEQRRKARKGEAADLTQNLAKTVAGYESAIKELKDKQDKTTTKAQYDAIERQIKTLEKQRDAITGGKDVSTKTKKEAVDEKEVRVKSFAEELEEKKNLYELYNRWILTYGKESADEQFKDLRAKNADYLSYVTGEIERLETMRDVGYSGKLSNQDKFDLDALQAEKNRLSGGKSATEIFTDKLDAAREAAGSLTEELEELHRIQKELNPNDKSTTGLANMQAVMQREQEVQRERKRMLSEFLTDVIGSEQQRLAITKHYNDLRATLDSVSADKKSETYLKALARIDKAEKKELENIHTKTIEESDAYKELQKIIDESTKDETAKRLKAEKDRLALLTAGTDKYIEQLKRVKAAEDDHREHSIRTWQIIGSVIGELGDTMQSFGGTIGEIGGALSGLAKNAGSLSSILSMKKGDKVSVDQYAAAIQGVIQIISTLVEAGKKRREAERQFAAERLGFENDYQNALIKEKGDNFKKNPFYKDYDGVVKAAVDQYKSAFDKYQAAIDKLEEGKAKERQKNAVDGKTVGQLAGAGAVAGALIGSLVGPVGTVVGAAVGAVVGAVAGLFAKKKKDVFGSLLEQYPELVATTANGIMELNVAMAQALIANDQVDASTKALIENALALNESLEDAKNKIQEITVELTGQVGDNLKNALVEAFRAGDQAAQALHGTVSDIIADVTSKLLFSALVGPALDQLAKEMTESLTNGDGAIVDDLVRFDQYGLPAVEQYFAGLEEFDKWAKSKGFDDVFGRGTGASNDQALQGVIKGVSEETVSVLIGQTNAIRIYQAQMAFDTRQAVLHLSAIAQNTTYNKHLLILFDVVDRLDRINDTSTRGFGL